MNSKILTILAITILIANMLPAISAEIIWSNPVTVGFTITDTGDNEDNSGCGEVKARQYAEETQTNYGEWTCSGNRLQRVSIVDGQQKTEFGGACGLNLDESSYSQNTHSTQTSISDNLIIAAVILIILILIVLVLIALRLTQLN
jgi:hypothetical protein